MKGKKQEIPAVKSAERAATKLNLEVKLADMPWFLFSSDHLSFRLRGVSNSVTISLLPVDELPILERFVSNLDIPRLLIGHRPAIPGVLSNVHKYSDDSSRISEDSLKLMLSLLVEIIEFYDF